MLTSINFCGYMDPIRRGGEGVRGRGGEGVRRKDDDVLYIL